MPFQTGAQYPNLPGSMNQIEIYLPVFRLQRSRQCSRTSSNPTADSESCGNEHVFAIDTRFLEGFTYFVFVIRPAVSIRVYPARRAAKQADLHSPGRT